MNDSGGDGDESSLLHPNVSTVVNLLFVLLGSAVGFVCTALPRVASRWSVFVRRWVSFGIFMAFLCSAILAGQGDPEDYVWWAFIGVFLLGPITFFATRLFVRVFGKD